MATLKCSAVQNEINNIITCLEPFLPLINNHMVGYFSKSLYNMLPQDLRTEISNVGYEEVLNIIFNNNLNLEASSVNEYIGLTKSLHLYNLVNVCLTTLELNTKLLEWGCNNISSLKLEVFITPKKSHEVEVLSKIAAAIHSINKTSHVIDIGDGKGYLSSMLALHHHIPVLGVDASAVSTHGAVKRTGQLAKAWTGISKNSKNSVSAQGESIICSTHDQLYKQITEFVTDDTDFKQLIYKVFLENPSGFGLVGLHTCGNLGSTSVKLFHSNKDVRTLCNVSCCYHLLKEEFEYESETYVSHTSGFPLSRFLNDCSFKLGRTARMLSAQSIDRILFNKILPGKVIFYRALLEVLLEKLGISVTKRQAGRFRKEFKSFAEYAHSALKNIDPDIHVSNVELNELFNTYKTYEDQLNVFYLLRCMLAPAIESLILLDRLLFLHENQHENAFLIQLFDPVISPRCYGLIAFKDE